MRAAFRTVIADIEKLRDYRLSETHVRGRDKARVFRSRLGPTAADAESLRRTLLDAATRGDGLIATSHDQYGTRYTLELEIATDQAQGTIRSAWIIRTNEDVLRFVSCYLL